MSAGLLRDLVQIYHGGEGSALWVTGRRAYADAEVTGSRVSPASYAVNANEVTFLLRRQRLRLGDLIVWGARTTMVSAITEEAHSGYMTASCAMVRRYSCRKLDDTGTPSEEEADAFEGVLCEKYNKYVEMPSYATNETTFILIVPTGCELELGSGVEIGDKAYAVQILHDTADGAKQYEVWRRADL